MVFIEEQNTAGASGLRATKEPGDPQWCWQTISYLQSIWQSLTLDYDRYLEAWTEAEEQRVWERCPTTTPLAPRQRCCGNSRSAMTSRPSAAWPSSRLPAACGFSTAGIGGVRSFKFTTVNLKNGRAATRRNTCWGVSSTRTQPSLSSWNVGNSAVCAPPRKRPGSSSYSPSAR